MALVLFRSCYFLIFLTVCEGASVSAPGNEAVRIHVGVGHRCMHAYTDILTMAYDIRVTYRHQVLASYEGNIGGEN